jgi:dTDP-4-dehydrorhamnose reductase
LSDDCTILLLGAGGQVGRELLHGLASLGAVKATLRTSSTAPALAGCATLDLANFVAVRELIARLQPQVVVNSAAYTAVDKAESDVEAAEGLNARLPGVLAEACQQAGAALVHYSTDYVFDGSGDRPWRENDPIHPLSVYGRTKAEGEQAVRDACARHLILRTQWVYGAHGKNFVKTMLHHGASKPELRVVSDQIGAPTSARVIADCTAQMLAQARGDFRGWFEQNAGTVNLTCSGETSWHGFAEAIFAMARALDLPLAVERVLAIKTDEYPTPAVRPLNSRLDLSLLAERFGLRPPNWREALAQTIGDIVRV